MEEPNNPDNEKKAPDSNKAGDIFRSAMKRIESIPFQPVWDRAREEMKVALKALEKGTERAKKETVKVSHQARIQYEIFLQNHELQKKMTALGERTYALSKKDPGTPASEDNKSVEIMKKIGLIEKKIAAFKTKARSLKVSRRSSGS